MIYSQSRYYEPARCNCLAVTLVNTLVLCLKCLRVKPMCRVARPANPVSAYRQLLTPALRHLCFDLVLQRLNLSVKFFTLFFKPPDKFHTHKSSSSLMPALRFVTATSFVMIITPLEFFAPSRPCLKPAEPLCQPSPLASLHSDFQAL